VLIEVAEAHLHDRQSSSVALLGLLRDCGYRLFQIGLFGRREIDASRSVDIANILAQAER
jgi:hypothetical protein